MAQGLTLCSSFPLVVFVSNYLILRTVTLAPNIINLSYRASEMP
jgi:hypothetical protein